MSVSLAHHAAPHIQHLGNIGRLLISAVSILRANVPRPGTTGAPAAAERSERFGLVSENLQRRYVESPSSRMLNRYHSRDLHREIDGKLTFLLVTTAYCTNYLCPGTLACVHFPHHCPCAWPKTEDKVELGDGSMICASKGGYKMKEMERKVELARKGLL